MELQVFRCFTAPAHRQWGLLHIHDEVGVDYNDGEVGEVENLASKSP